MTLDTDNKTIVNVKGVDAELWAKVKAEARENQVYVGTMLSHILRAHYYPHVLSPMPAVPAFESLVGALEQTTEPQTETPKRITLKQFKDLCESPKPHKDMSLEELEAEWNRLHEFEPTEQDGKKRIEMWDASMGPLSFYLNKARKAEKGGQ